MDYKIDLTWDPEASVWIATSNDVPGLILESGSYDALIERVRYTVPELFEINNNKITDYQLVFVSRRCDRVSLNG